jgi:3-phenylpropionate/cinnamic acid dioxygenase small subunit
MELAHQLAVENLLARYIHCIDEDRLEDWPAFFAENCRYQITTAENHERGLPIGIFFATSRGQLKDRVSALREANIYEPQRYRHITSSILITGQKDGLIEARANFQIIRIMHNGAMDLFCTGRYLDRIAGSGPDMTYVEKLAILDNKRIDTLLALPV